MALESCLVTSIFAFEVCQTDKPCFGLQERRRFGRHSAFQPFAPVDGVKTWLRDESVGNSIKWRSVGEMKHRACLDRLEASETRPCHETALFADEAPQRSA
jgi:hypothetical protein